MENEIFKLIAGHPALDFVNSSDGRYAPEGAVELLGSYADLLQFGLQAQLLTRKEARAAAETSKRVQGEVLSLTHELREGLFRIFTAMTSGEEPATKDGALLNKWLAAAGRHRELAPGDERFIWRWKQLKQQAPVPLWRIAWTAGELLASEEASFVRECKSETCRWLFLDLSKNHSRRWCDMNLCGNRAKARQFYKRHGN